MILKYKLRNKFHVTHRRDRSIDSNEHNLNYNNDSDVEIQNSPTGSRFLNGIDKYVERTVFDKSKFDKNSYSLQQ